MNLLSGTSQYGQAINHPLTYDFIASELLSYGSYVGNFYDDNQRYIRVLISYPRSLFGHQPQVFIALQDYAIQIVDLPSYQSGSFQSIYSENSGLSELISISQLLQFLDQIILRLV